MVLTTNEQVKLIVAMPQAQKNKIKQQIKTGLQKGQGGEGIFGTIFSGVKSFFGSKIGREITKIGLNLALKKLGLLGGNGFVTTGNGINVAGGKCGNGIRLAGGKKKKVGRPRKVGRPKKK
jgi:hypothetical protein